ncbi:unnamed protein product [Pleuronectes platessa]|uniref:Uncharacterized protein n=1 Tax=Pleuronectes platessa TaxID=8262 RepID=A0A9N7VXI8_PLEPL|nr:unnamed protein product [Pleuronectes platessa]
MAPRSTVTPQLSEPMPFSRLVCVGSPASSTTLGRAEPVKCPQPRLLRCWRCPAVSNRRWTQSRSWAQNTFRSLTQCVIVSPPAVLWAVGYEDNSRYFTFQTSHADLTGRMWKRQ